MKKGLEEKRTMFYALREFVETTPEATLELMPGFAAAFGIFTTTLLEIPEQSETQTMNRVGNRIVKDELKLQMVLEAMNVQYRVRAYAQNIGDVYLFNLMNKSKSTLLRGRDTIVADLCEFIRSTASGLLANLGTYGVTAADLTSLEGKIAGFIVQIPKPRLGIMERKEATIKIDGLFGKCDVAVKSMDRLVDMLEFSDGEFYSRYFSARKIIRTGSRTISLVGRVFDENNVAVELVDVLIKDSLLKRKTTALGGFEFKNLASGTYDVVFSKSGYMDATVSVPITATERTSIDVVLKLDNSLMKVA